MNETAWTWRLNGVVRRYEDARLVEEFRVSSEERSSAFCFAGAVWFLKFSTNGEGGCRVDLDLVSGNAKNVSLAMEVVFPRWSREHYLLMPGVVYAGNRFACRPEQYPPMLMNPADLGLGKGPFITDVPRLNDGEGLSQIQLLAGGMASPHIGVFDPRHRQGAFVIYDPFRNGHESGVTFRENDDRASAALSIATPGVRAGTRYSCCTTRMISNDRGADMEAGDSMSVRVRFDVFACDRIPDLFARLLEIRSLPAGDSSLATEFPFSAAWKILEEKYNRDNWNPAGYYRIGMGENRQQDFQTGWAGGLMNSLALLHEGSEVSRQRALATLDLVLARGGSSPSGFFHGVYHRGVWSGDGFDIDRRTPRQRPDPERNHYHLLRKSADALYFVFRHFDLLRRRQRNWIPPGTWMNSTRSCADAFVRMWERYGELGQFVDVRNGDIIIGGSSSAGIAPAGLALAASFFGEQKYLDVAQEIGTYFHERFTSNGLSNGGPGEILQCPDSESAAGLLEGYVVLWERTGDVRWLEAAEEAAAQFASWQVPYDYSFPPDSEFGRLGMRSTGAVFANSQNGHGAPGICTLSGNSLFKLYRATGNEIYLRLILELARNLTQYLSRADRPIHANDGKALPAGWINERVNTSDWDENLGGVFRGSTWSEVALMLTIMDIPGVYVRVDRNEATSFDHVEASPVVEDGRCAAVSVTNPTRYEATVKLLIEDAVTARHPLRENYLWNAQTIRLAPGAKKVIQFEFDQRGGNLSGMLIEAGAVVSHAAG